MNAPDSDPSVSLFAASAGHVRFVGADHLDFLHRMSTNHVSGLAVGDGQRTVFCDHRGRIGHLVTLCRPTADDTHAFVGADAGGAGDTGAFLEWLEHYHFAERVEWRDAGAGADAGQLRLIGHDAVALARDVIGVPADDLAALGVTAVDGGWVQRHDLGPRPGLRIWGTEGDLAALRLRLEAGGATPIDGDTWERLRIEAGVPAAAELTDAHNPWEAGLTDAIHMNKGCYIGQEVVARLDTYQKVKQHLVGLRLQAAIAPQVPVRVDAGDVDARDVDARDVGVVTSCATSSRLGPIALAYVRTAHATPGTELVAGDTAATVAALPFDAT